MKKKICILLILMFAVILPASANEYVNGAYGIYVDSMKFVTGPNGERQIEMILPNMSQEPIEAVAIELIMLDGEKQPVLAYSPDAAGFLQEMNISNYSNPLMFKNPLEPGKDGRHVQTIAPEYSQAVEARAAVTYYRRSSGEEFFVAPSVMLWNHTDGTRLPPAAGGAYYPGLTQEQKQLSTSFPLGMMRDSRVLYDFLAPSYGLSEGGVWIHEVSEGSLGAKLGLMAGDLLVSVDGVRLDDNNLAIDLGKVKMAQGEQVEFVWLRNGETMKGSIGKE